MDDLNILVQSLNQLSSENFHVPQVELEVFSTSEFINSKYQFQTAKLISDFDKKKKYDLLIDISILDRNENPNIISTNSEEIKQLQDQIDNLKQKCESLEAIQYKNENELHKLMQNIKLQNYTK
jgi:hypothetical protein